MDRLSQRASSRNMASSIDGMSSGASRIQETVPLTPVTSLLQSSRKSVSSVSDRFQESAKSLSESIALPESVTSSKPFSMLGFSSPLFWILLVILLSILGFNIFRYLAEGTELFASIMRPITSMFASITGDTTKTAASNVSTGGKKIVETTSDATQSTIDYATKGLVGGINMLQDKLKSVSVVEPENANDMSESAKPANPTNGNKQKAKQQVAPDEDSEPDPVRTESVKGGYCYIGKINDTRYCSKVSSRNYCMSGDIYPSMDVCVNQNLRN
jgi:hypothetical protein